MKKIILPLVAVAAIGAVAPKFVGSQVNASLNDVVTHINNMPGYQASLSHIESSWFNTTADVTVKFEMPPMTDAPTQQVEAYGVDIKFSATHGPILFGQHSGLGWTGWTVSIDGEQLRQHAKWPSMVPIYQLTSTMGLFGQHNFTDSMPQVSTTGDDGSSFQFSGYAGQGTYTGDALTYSGVTKELSAQAPFLEVNGKELSITMDMESSIAQALEMGLYNSNSKFSLASLVVKTGENESVTTLDNTYISAVTTIDDDNVLGGIAMSYGVDKVQSANFNAEDIALDMEFNNLSAKVAQAWQKFSEQLGGAAPDEVMVKMQSFGDQHLLTLLQAQPQINITSLRLTLPEGKVDSNMHTSLVGIDTLPDNLQNLQFWLSHMLMTGKIEGDKAAVEYVASQVMKQQLMASPQAHDMSDEQKAQVEQVALEQIQGMLGMLTQQGMVKATESNYVSELKFENSQLTVNGQVIPLPIPGA